MLYCTKCHGVCQDSTLKCPNCKSTNLRQVKDDDYVLLHRADQYTAQRLAEQFDQQGVAYQLEPFVGGWVSYLYDSDVLPTDKMIVVRYGDLPKARELSVQVRDQIDREREAEQGEENFEEMPFKKRVLVQVLSVIAFLLVVMLVVFGADAVANWIKGLFS